MEQHRYELDEEIPHILIVDDDLINQKIAARILMDKNRVSCVSSAQEGFAFLKREIPNLILLDIHMPEVDGFAMLRQLKEDDVYRSIPVVFLTADDDQKTEIDGFQAGVLDFITKPFVAEVVRQRVGRILELDRLQRHLEQEVARQTQKAENRREKVERMLLQTMKTLAGAIDAKDTYTNGHSARVAEYAKLIAAQVGKSEREQENIYFMGLMHDIGKIGVPDEIINKTTRLTDEEYAVIKTHPSIGADILKDLTEIPNIAIGARWHHERYDGCGYPDGLKGEEIPEVARIIGVADAYDAMTSNRSYRDYLPQEVVREQIQRGSGTQFDPQFAEVMLRLIDLDTDYRMREGGGTKEKADTKG